MPESVAMPPEETVSKSPLDKPLHLLTEEDISQLTREDCRRYLKEKGMRRPSWNKSQAIQQVISLKTLLESDSDAATRKKLYIPRPENQQRVHRGTSADTEVSASAEDSFPNRPKDADKPDLSGDLSGHLVAADNDSPPISVAKDLDAILKILAFSGYAFLTLTKMMGRTTGVTNGPVGQMTIFYCGKVNVYDDVPSDKAQAIMQLAASPLHSPCEAPNDAVRSIPFRLQATSVKVGPDPSFIPLPSLQTAKMADNSRLHRQESNISIEDHPAEGPPSRKASVQRYLEKRKDRLKSKRKVGTPSSSSWDLYFNHQIPNENSSRSGPCSPPPIKPPDTPNRSSSVENNIVKPANLSAAPSEKDLQD